MRISGVALGLFLLAGSAIAQNYVPVIPDPDRLAEGIRFDDIFVEQMPDGTIHEFNRCGAPRVDQGIEVLGPLSPLGGSTADCDGSSNPDPMYDPFPGGSYLIDVWVHVIQNDAGTQGQVPLAEIHEQLAVLNEDFRAIPGSNGAPGSDTRFFFRLVGTEITNNTTFFNDGGFYYNTLAQSPATILNIYTNQAGGNLGYVPFLPHQSPGSIGTNADRAVILWSTFGRNRGLFPAYDLGRTTTHELGHFFGLEHTFAQGGCPSAANPACLSNGDWVCDTPPENAPNFNVCPPGTVDSCTGQPGNDPIENYMDYSDDVCMDRFTQHQQRRIRCTIEHYRSGLLQPILFYDDFETGNTFAWDFTN
ncbi:MAG: zinc metalloprotease [Thermoanaerobaculia bacterium]